MGDLAVRGDNGGLSGRQPWRDIPLAGEGAATMVISRNPLVSPQPVAVRPFTPLRDLAPDVRGALMLRVNGAWLLRKDWGRVAAPGDVIEWHEIPQGGNASRTILSIVIVVVSLWLPGALNLVGWEAAAVTAAVNIAGNVLLNAILPIKPPDTPGGGMSSPESVYNVGASANQARIYQPIPVIYGRQPVYPDYASQPYISYSNNDQYFYALYCIGQGEYVIPESDILLDDTPLSHFSDVTYRVLPPGTPAEEEAPAGALFSISTRMVHPAVITAPEVAGQAIVEDRYTPAFSACGPGKRARQIEVDVLFDRLGRANDEGNMETFSVSVVVQARYIDDYGVPVGAWANVGAQTFSAASTSPQRHTMTCVLPQPGRVQVRMARTSRRDESSRVFNDPVWGGLRAFLAYRATLCPTATHLELRMRASEQLSGLSQRKIKVIPRRKLQTWAPGTGYSAPVETRNPAWALLDIWRNPVYGDGLPDSRIDLHTLYRLAQIWDARQDRCDVVFDSRMTSWEAARIVARTGRAVPFRRLGVNTLVRDERQSLPVAAYTTRNMLLGASIGYALATEETADGVIAEYFDGRMHEWREVTCPAPGVTAPKNPGRIRYLGITGRTHAEREGLYEAAQNVYRRKFPRWQTELEGMLPAFGSLVVCAPPMAKLIQAGDVTGWNAETRTLSLTEPPEFVPGASHFIALHRDDGSVTAPIAAQPGPSAREVVLSALPDFTPSFDNLLRERTRYFFGTSEGHRTYTRVLGIRRMGRSAEGAETVELSGVVEDERIHTVDAHLLPAPGAVQDPIDSPNRTLFSVVGGTFHVIGLKPESGPERIVLVDFTDHYISSSGDSQNAQARITLRADGTLQTYTTQNGTQTVPSQWLRYTPVEQGTAMRFDVRATLVDGLRIYAYGDAEPLSQAPQGDALGEWLSLGTDRTWGYTPDPDYGITAQLRIEIRERATGTVHASQVVALSASNIPAGNGG